MGRSFPDGGEGRIFLKEFLNNWQSPIMKTFSSSSYHHNQFVPMRIKAKVQAAMPEMRPWKYLISINYVNVYFSMRLHLEWIWSIGTEFLWPRKTVKGVLSVHIWAFIHLAQRYPFPRFIQKTSQTFSTILILVEVSETHSLLWQKRRETYCFYLCRFKAYVSLSQFSFMSGQ